LMRDDAMMPPYVQPVVALKYRTLPSESI